MRFYKDHYDVVIIGGALAGMAAALQLQAKGVRDILILEKHNMPGGVATDYMRDGFEMEASLHEMMSIGPKGKRLKVGQFFDDMGIDIDWLPPNTARADKAMRYGVSSCTRDTPKLPSPACSPRAVPCIRLGKK